YRDRLTGRCVPTPPLTGTLVGRWVLEHDYTKVFMNSAAATGGDFLVPEASGHWNVHISDGNRQSGTTARAHSPQDFEAESVSKIGNRLDELIKAGATWLEW